MGKSIEEACLYGTTHRKHTSGIIKAPTGGCGRRGSGLHRNRAGSARRERCKLWKETTMIVAGCVVGVVLLLTIAVLLLIAARGGIIEQMPYGADLPE